MIADQTPLTPQEEREVQRVRQILLAPATPAGQLEGACGEETNFAPHFAPLPPIHTQNGPKFGADGQAGTGKRSAAAAAESRERQEVAQQDAAGAEAAGSASITRISDHGARGAGAKVDCHRWRRARGKRDPRPDPAGAAQSKRGRPAAFDDHSRGNAPD